MDQPHKSAEPTALFQKGLHIGIERPWLSRFHFLKTQGYLQRARYRPGWVPSWKDKPDVFMLECEDGVQIRHGLVLDAQRISDGQFIRIEEVKLSSKEGLITCYLSSEHLKNDPLNHAIPVLDVLRDVVRTDSVLLVLPLLRYITDPAISSVSEALDLGLVFLHEHEVAHRDCAFGKIMMDARALFPTHGTLNSLTAISRIKLTSTSSREQTLEGEVQLRGLAELEDSPELSDRVPYNPYKLDVYILGKMYHRIILGHFINLTLLEPLVKRMTSEKPEDRPTTAKAYAIFQELRSETNLSVFSQRLLTKEESKVTRLIKGSRYWLHKQWVRLGPKPRLPPFY